MIQLKSPSIGADIKGYKHEKLPLLYFFCYEKEFNYPDLSFGRVRCPNTENSIGKIENAKSLLLYPIEKI